MKYLKEKKKFIKFLKDNGIYNKFYNALRSYLKNTIKTNRSFGKKISIPTDLFEKYEPDQWMIEAFEWCNTKGKFTFWSPLDDAWTKLINNK